MPGTARRLHRATLSREDVKLLSLLAEGMPMALVARHMHLSERSVRRRVRTICDQLGVRTSIQAVAWAARRGLV
ncbi:helix-turn-helix transcriptional regulator [Actinobacteria bacterium YIM 96077]|uniref:Helix-turn-helix transcriptional regulator n=1 Tax=Phytoactinopolyspora halophila TaxID=1981511 RepID=A0A329QKW8_9ACTN|nr:LuxR C-terminal-related transcriptional regulator [Phytoactinopolyspora halophila]AYY12566.1 helix-turn-helix transcriptional regulator [Actinobacteria bacterium YIM 96077]RAW12531.1 helix-turn-helix transcriptional regulator [Phytoactinopolyspora halophila]